MCPSYATVDASEATSGDFAFKGARLGGDISLLATRDFYLPVSGVVVSGRFDLHFQ